MSEPTKAVFLSYASQDAEAVRRIAEALRGAGIEVWFDVEGGLETGDEWDAKIRRQIKECVLFLPVISANTQAREEGYFRIEWDLAAERARGIASGVPFILPIVIDGTKEAEALVPDRFRAVQWTRVPDGAVPSDVRQRLVRLWSQRTGANRRENVPAAPAGATPTRAPVRRVWPWLVAGAGVLAAAGLFWRGQSEGSSDRGPGAGAPMGGGSPVVAGAGATPAAREWPADPELRQAYQLANALNAIREDLLLAEEMALKVVQRSPADAEAVTVLAHIESTLLVRNFDFTADRTTLARRYCERAVQLAPDSPVALAAQAMFLVQRGGDIPRGEALLRRAAQLAPEEPRYARYLARVVSLQNGAEGAQAGMRLQQQVVARFPRDPLARYDLSVRLRDAGDYDGAERELDATLALAPLANAFDWKARFALMRGELPDTRAWLERVPPRLQTEERGLLTRVTYALFSGDVAYGLQALERYSEAWFYDAANFNGPRSLLRAALRDRQGNTELARVGYETALTEIRRRREARPNDPETHGMEAVALLGLGRRDEARAAHRISIAGATRPFRYFPASLWWFSLGPRILLLDEREAALAFLRELAADVGVREALLRRIRMDPRLAAYHHDPEVVALLAPPTPPAASRVAPADAKSVAVLPFANLSGDATQEYFSDGLTEEILNALARERDLRVPGRTSSFSFKGKNVSAAEIARVLNVARLVEGSVRRSGNKVRISVSLTRASDGFSEELGTFTEDLEDIFALQDKVASTVVAKLTNRAAAAGSGARRTVNPEAYGLYLQARAAWAQRTDASHRQAEQLLLRVLEREPAFAPAMALLSTNYSVITDGAEASRQAALWADRALAADPNLAEALAAKALSLSDGGDYAGAIRMLRRSIQVDPSFASGHQWLGRELAADGDIEGAIAALQTAAQLDPLSPRILDNYAAMLAYVGRVEEALTIIDEVLARQPAWQQGIQFRAQFLLQLGRPDEALPTFLDPDMARRSPAWVVKGLLAAGRREEAEKVVVGLPADTTTALALCVLGRPREGLAIMRPRFSRHREFILWLHPEAMPRDLPEFHAALKEWGLSEGWARAEAWRAAHRPKKTGTNR